MFQIIFVILISIKYIYSVLSFINWRAKWSELHTYSMDYMSTNDVINWGRCCGDSDERTDADRSTSVWFREFVLCSRKAELRRDGVMKYACLVRLERRVCIRPTCRDVVARTVCTTGNWSKFSRYAIGSGISYLYGATKKREMSKTSKIASDFWYKTSLLLNLPLAES